MHDWRSELVGWLIVGGYAVGIYVACRCLAMLIVRLYRRLHRRRCPMHRLVRVLRDMDAGNLGDAAGLVGAALMAHHASFDLIVVARSLPDGQPIALMIGTGRQADDIVAGVRETIVGAASVN